MRSMKNISIRFLAQILTLVTVFTVLPIYAFNSETEPIEINDSVTVNANEDVLIDIVFVDEATDTDLGDLITEIKVAPAKALKCYVVNGDKIYYKPQRRAEGTDVFSYEVKSDYGELYATVTVTVTIVAVNEIHTVSLSENPATDTALN